MSTALFAAPKQIPSCSAQPFDILWEAVEILEYIEPRISRLHAKRLQECVVLEALGEDLPAYRIDRTVGPDGPIDSIRWEIFAESFQDYALLQTLGVQPGDTRLDVFEDFNRFPKDVEWLRTARRDLLRGCKQGC